VEKHGNYLFASFSVNGFALLLGGFFLMVVGRYVEMKKGSRRAWSVRCLVALLLPVLKIMWGP
jgi:hypothetical protein